MYPVWKSLEKRVERPEVTFGDSYLESLRNKKDTIGTVMENNI